MILNVCLIQQLRKGERHQIKTRWSHSRVMDAGETGVDANASTTSEPGELESDSGVLSTQIRPRRIAHCKQVHPGHSGSNGETRVDITWASSEPLGCLLPCPRLMYLHLWRRCVSFWSPTSRYQESGDLQIGVSRSGLGAAIARQLVPNYPVETPSHATQDLILLDWQSLSPKLGQLPQYKPRAKRRL